MQRSAFQIGLFLIAASTLMYEIVLTRLLSVISWYYLAFVSVSMAMFGMTVGALAVQLKPALFTPEQIPRRLAQSCAAMAVSTPLALVMMLAIPVDLSLSAQVLFSFLLFSAVIAVPFFFSGVAVCLSLTRSPIPIGRTYFVDLAGAAAGCYLAIVALSLTDGPSVMFLISALLFVSTASYATHAGEALWRKRAGLAAVAMLALAALNSATLYGIQPIWSKGKIDRRTGLLAEIWNPISKVRAMRPHVGPPLMWGPSPRMPAIERESINLNIDNDAATSILRYRGDMSEFDFLRYDVTSLAAQLRQGGDAAIIGVGGGRDVLNAAVNGFRSIVGIEVNSAIVDLCARRLDWFSGFSKIPGLEIQVDEGRSFLTRTGRKFDLIQASLVDTWAATSAGAMTLTENALYTVEGWQIFYRHLKPGGLISFSRWQDTAQTPRLFSVAWAMLLAEGVADPSPH
ncbi:MAG: spermidine synthase, partial [Candidatus Acidiferrales bacterium]